MTKPRTAQFMSRQSSWSRLSNHEQYLESPEQPRPGCEQQQYQSVFVANLGRVITTHPSVVHSYYGPPKLAMVSVYRNMHQDKSLPIIPWIVCWIFNVIFGKTNILQVMKGNNKPVSWTQSESVI